MLPSFTKLFSTSASATKPQAAATLKTSAHTMPNGLIQDSQVQYNLAHAFDGAKLRLAVDAGAGHTSVTAYPSNHEPAAVQMTKEGEMWVAELHGFKPGEEVEVHFVIENNGQQVDNATAKHKIALDNVSSDPNAPVKHRMPNGMINGKKIDYGLDHKFDGEALTLRLDAGEGHTAVTAYPTPHDPAAVAMTKDGNVWVAQLKGFKPGDEIDVHFVIESSGQQVDNSTARHRIAVPAK